MSIVYLRNKKNGVTYVYESKGYWDKEKKQARNQRKYIGKIDPATGEIIHSKKYQGAAQQSAEQGLLSCQELRSSFYGATYLFDTIGEKLGVTEDLKKCFPDSYRQIMSIAYYLIMENYNPLSRFPKWARTHANPCGRIIPSQRGNEFFAAFKEEEIHKFFQLQHKRRSENEYLVYGVASVASFSKSLKRARLNLDKGPDPLSHVNLAVVFGESSRLPVYFKTLPINITDAKAVPGILSDIGFLSNENTKLVMGRGFYSEKNVNELYKDRRNFLIAAKMATKPVREKLDEARDRMTYQNHYSTKYGIYYDSFLMNWDYSETRPRTGDVFKDARNMYLHLFYNDQRAADDKIALNKLLDNLEEELASGWLIPEYEKFYARYYEILNNHPERRLSITQKQDAVAGDRKNYGYFAFISNDIKEPLQALDVYCAKSMIETAFGNIKERVNMRRTSEYSEENIEGRLFVQFVALIYMSYIKKTMNENDLYRRYTMHELLDELDVIERFEQHGKKPFLGEITKKQLYLYERLGVRPPHWYN
ncbi:MAG: transposase [Synergistaceae bacterium]|jgi:spore coat protein CotF|nr:transposase [Synergistaceae bacterium]